MKKKFEHCIGAHVELAMSKEKGRVIARAKFETGVRQYLVRYLAADGRQTEGWFESDALRKINAARSLGDLLTAAVIEEAKAPTVLLPHMRINDAAIESVKLKAEPYVAKPNGEELEAIKSHLSSLSNSVAALQTAVSSLDSQFVVLADRFSVSAQ
jgi:hypothetical protein